MTDPRTPISWIDIYSAHGDQLFAVAMAITGRRELAEDAIQDAFLGLYSRSRCVQNAKSYAFQAVRNSARMILRCRRRVGEPDESLPLAVQLADVPNEASRCLEHVELKAILKNTLQELNETEREVIVMHLQADLKFQEITEVVGRSMGTVTSQYRRGLEKIRRALARAEIRELPE